MTMQDKRFLQGRYKLKKKIRVAAHFSEITDQGLISRTMPYIVVKCFEAFKIVAAQFSLKDVLIRSSLPFYIHNRTA